MHSPFLDSNLANTLFNSITSIVNLRDAYFADKEKSIRIGNSVYGDLSYIEWEKQLEANLLELQRSLRSGHYQLYPLINDAPTLHIRDRIAEKAIARYLGSFFKEFPTNDSSNDSILRASNEGYKYFAELQGLFKVYEDIPYVHLIDYFCTFVDSDLLRNTMYSILGNGTYTSANDAVGGSHVGTETGPFLYNLYFSMLDEFGMKTDHKIVRYEDVSIMLFKEPEEADEALGRIGAYLITEMGIQLQSDDGASIKVPLHSIESLVG